MKKALIIAVAALALLAAFAVADPGHRGRGDSDMARGMGERGMGHGADGFFGPGMLLKAADEIGLDDGQKAKISQMAEQFGLERIDKKAALDKAELELRHMRMNDAADNEILSQMDKVGKLKTEMQKMKFSHRQAVKGVLTEQQIDKLKELRQEKGKERGHFGGHGLGHGKGMAPDAPGQGFGPGTGPNNADCWKR
ncbi:MAG: hypothetical protein CVT49_03750 [candidate division Zixibacteria bacterium HGW-Zixibacteria-1]|nr:MAG: hypothetical protein CVT49_03750 [candidate division Zixibacteria bacterium HGW-Zixibacteria-1]